MYFYFYKIISRTWIWLFYIIYFVNFNIALTFFLAYLNCRFKWAIRIICCPSSVCLSVKSSWINTRDSEEVQSLTNECKKKMFKIFFSRTVHVMQQFWILLCILLNCRFWIVKIVTPKNARRGGEREMEREKNKNYTLIFYVR